MIPKVILGTNQIIENMHERVSFESSRKNDRFVSLKGFSKKADMRELNVNVNTGIQKLKHVRV